MHPSYQLTKHPLGSVKEMWAISWPLMLSFLSISLMMFVDRLMIAHYSTQALNAVTHASNLCFVPLVPLLVITSISEVLVGRFHGAGNLKLMGMPVWQMLWVSLMTLPLFLLFNYFAFPYLLQGSENEWLELNYITIIMWMGPFFCSTTALTGFFIGAGRVKIVTLSTLFGNVVNFVLGLVLIFGWGGIIPSLGAKGAAFAWGFGQFCQTVFLFSLFLSRKNRKECGTLNWKFNLSCFIESLRISLPPGIHIFFEMSAIVVFMHLMLLAGPENLTIAAVAQSFWFLLNFLIEGLGKGITTISSNLIGGNQLDKITKALKSAFSIHLVFFALLSLILFFCSSAILPLFFSEKDQYQLHNASFVSGMNLTWVWITIFFLFDGFARILGGQLISAGDSKYIFYVGIISNYVIFLSPVVYLVLYHQVGAAEAWLFAPVSALFNCFFLYRRFKSNAWRKGLVPEGELQFGSQ